MRKRKYILKENFFENIDTEEKAYWLGFLYADGYNNEKKYDIKIRLAIKDEDFLLMLRDTLFPNRDKPLSYYKKGDQIKSCELLITSKIMSKQLSQHGCKQKKTFDISFPYNINENLYRHFIRGVFDGDGTICLTTLNSGEHKTMFSIIGYKPFMEEINEIIANKCNLNCNKLIEYKGKDERIATVAFSGCKQCMKIREFLYQDATIFMQRKYDKFMLLGTNMWKTYESYMNPDIKKLVNCCECNRTLTYKHKIYNKEGKIYCYRCYNKLFVPSKKRTNNNIIIKGDEAILLIKNYEIYFDLEDIDIVEHYKWHIENGRVVCRWNKPKKCIYLNRLLLNAQEGQSVAFKDKNCFNMRKENLEKRDHK